MEDDFGFGGDLRGLLVDIFLEVVRIDVGGDAVAVAERRDGGSRFGSLGNTPETSSMARYGEVNKSTDGE